MGLLLLARRAAADCGNNRAATTTHLRRGALTAAAIPTPNGRYDIVIKNMTKAWYNVEQVTPSAGSCWPANEPPPTRFNWAGTNVPDLIKPEGTITIEDVPLFAGDRLGICRVGYTEGLPADLAGRRRWAQAITIADILSHLAYGDSVDVLGARVLNVLMTSLNTTSLNVADAYLRVMIQDALGGLSWNEAGSRLLDAEHAHGAAGRALEATTQPDGAPHSVKTKPPCPSSRSATTPSLP